MKDKAGLGWLILFICVTIEALCHIFLRTLDRPLLISTLYLLVGLAIGLIPLFISKWRVKSKSWIFSGMHIVFLAALIGICLYAVNTIYIKYPIDHKIADMLPVIKTMCARFLEGEEIYARIPEIWNVRPIYLPALWMPFLPAVLIDIDVRYTTLAMIFMGLLSVFLLSSKYKSTNPLTLVAWMPIIIIFTFILFIDIRLLGVTQEGVIIGLYLLLGFSLLRNHASLIGVFLACCLFSRYALLFWTPVFAIIVLSSWKREKIGRALLAFLMTSAVLFVLSELYTQIFVHSKLYTTYDSAVQNPDRAWKYKPVIAEGFGLAKFLKYESVRDLFPVSIVLQGFMILVFGGLFLLRKSKFNHTLYLIGTLKCFLVIFYNFLFIPHLYLFFTSTFFSIVILIGMIDVQPRVMKAIAPE